MGFCFDPYDCNCWIDALSVGRVTG